jgi:hypothetical protein
LLHLAGYNPRLLLFLLAKQLGTLTFVFDGSIRADHVCISDLKGNFCGMQGTYPVSAFKNARFLCSNPTVAGMGL